MLNPCQKSNRNAKLEAITKKNPLPEKPVETNVEVVEEKDLTAKPPAMLENASTDPDTMTTTPFMLET